MGMMQNQLKLDGYALRNINYADNVVFEVYVENNQTEDVLAKVTDWCNARVETQIIDEEYLIEEC